MKNFDDGYELERVDEKGDVETLVVSREERLEREREFKIGGETFVHKIGIAPEVLLPWVTAADEPPSEADWLKVLDETVVAMLEPGQQDKWLKVRDPNAKNPLTQTDLGALVRWLIAETSGRPTGPPSDSSAGRDSTGTSSMEGSSSPELAAVSAS